MKKYSCQLFKYVIYILKCNPTSENVMMEKRSVLGTMMPISEIVSFTLERSVIAEWLWALAWEPSIPKFRFWDCCSITYITHKSLKIQASKFLNCTRYIIIPSPYSYYKGLPRWLSGKQSICLCKRHVFDPWVWKIPGDGNDNPLQCSRKFHGQRSLVGYSP